LHALILNGHLRWEALTGNPDKGIERLTAALQYNPLANYQWFVGQIDFMAERYDDAIQALNSLSSPNALVHAFLAASHGHLGNIPEAEKAASLFITKATELLNASDTTVPNSWIQFIIARYPFQHEDDAARLKAGLANAGIS
jgi:adenylate cyclase